MVTLGNFSQSQIYFSHSIAKGRLYRPSFIIDPFGTFIRRRVQTALTSQFSTHFLVRVRVVRFVRVVNVRIKKVKSDNE